MFDLVKFSQNRTLEEAEAVFQQRIKDAAALYEEFQATFIKRPCFICGSEDTTDVTAFHETYGIQQCRVCASLFVNPAPSPEALETYYNRAACNQHYQAILKKRHGQTQNVILDNRIRSVLEVLEKRPGNTFRILEIGCNTGSFLSRLTHFAGIHLPDKNVDLVGIDIDQSAIDNTLDPALELHCADAASFARQADQQFDLVLHFELIEHLIDPHRFMRDARNLMLVDATMIFTTPNLNGLEMWAADYNSTRLLAHAIFPPMHLNAFSTMNITHFALRCGYRVVDIQTPGLLDVDMLSQYPEQLNDDGLKQLAQLDEKTKGLFQYLITRLHASSHMLCVLEKNASV